MGLRGRLKGLVNTGKQKKQEDNSMNSKTRNKDYLPTSTTEVNNLNDNILNSDNSLIIKEIFETISSYLALFTLSPEHKFLIKDINRKVEEIEHVHGPEIINKYINDTYLSKRSRLVELLNLLLLTGESHKLSASPSGDDSEGYYIGFLLSNGNYVITWEPGLLQKLKEKELLRHGSVFDKFSDSMPEMIYEVNPEGKLTYANLQVL